MTDTEQRPAAGRATAERLRQIASDPFVGGAIMADYLTGAADEIDSLRAQLDQAIKDADRAIEHARRVDAKEREALCSALRELTRIYKVDGAGRTSAAEIDAAWRAAHDALKT